MWRGRALLPAQQPSMRAHVAHDEPGDDEDPYQHVQRDKRPPPLEHGLVGHRLPSPLSARLVWVKERLVRLDGRDGVAFGGERKIKPVVGEAGKQQREKRGNAGAPEKLERFNALQRRILPRTAERRDPPANTTDGDDHEPGWQTGVSLSPRYPVHDEEHRREPP